MRETEFFINKDGGDRLGATRFEASDARGVIVINSAMAVPRSLYADFSAWWCEQGFHVVTWSYSGMGDSGRAADCDALLQHWGEDDFNQVLAYCEQRWPNLPRIAMAHSVGGQVLGLAERSRDVAAILPIASQSGYWRHYRGGMRLRVLLLWYVLIPVLTRIAGVFPGRTLGIMPENIPPRVVRQWARWARDPGYLMGRHRPASAGNFAKITAPVLGVWIADDDMAPRSAHREMLSWYENAPVDMLELHPRNEGLDRIGHFGFFRADRGRETLWPQLLAWLSRQLDELESST